MIVNFGIHGLIVLHSVINPTPPPPPPTQIISAVHVVRTTNDPVIPSTVITDEYDEETVTIDTGDGFKATTGLATYTQMQNLSPETDDEYHARLNAEVCRIKGWTC